MSEKATVDARDIMAKDRYVDSEITKAQLKESFGRGIDAKVLAEKVFVYEERDTKRSIGTLLNGAKIKVKSREFFKFKRHGERLIILKVEINLELVNKAKQWKWRESQCHKGGSEYGFCKIIDSTPRTKLEFCKIQWTDDNVKQNVSKSRVDEFKESKHITKTNKGNAVHGWIKMKSKAGKLLVGHDHDIEEESEDDIKTDDECVLKKVVVVRSHEDDQSVKIGKLLVGTTIKILEREGRRVRIKLPSESEWSERYDKSYSEGWISLWPKSAKKDELGKWFVEKT